jgi:hypothetical protein
MSFIKKLLTESYTIELEPIHPTQCIGTSKKLQFNCDYEKLADRLGQPIFHPEGSDVQIEWCFNAILLDGTEFKLSIYNEPHYLPHVLPSEMDTWCIGCDTKYHATAVLMFLNS